MVHWTRLDKVRTGSCVINCLSACHSNAGAEIGAAHLGLQNQIALSFTLYGVLMVLIFAQHVLWWPTEGWYVEEYRPTALGISPIRQLS